MLSNVTTCSYIVGKRFPYGSKHLIYHVNDLSLYYKSKSFVHKNFCNFVEYMQSCAFTINPIDLVFEVLSPPGQPFVL